MENSTSKIQSTSIPDVTNKPEVMNKPLCTNKPQIKAFFIQENEDNHFIEIGIDEAGRGPMFGRVYSAAVILPKDADRTARSACSSIFFASRRSISSLNLRWLYLSDTHQLSAVLTLENTACALSFLNTLIAPSSGVIKYCLKTRYPLDSGKIKFFSSSDKSGSTIRFNLSSTCGFI